MAAAIVATGAAQFASSLSTSSSQCPGARHHGRQLASAGNVSPREQTPAARILRTSPLVTTRITFMGKGILLWLLGIPLPIIILLALFWH
ncbi:hypothetical protein [Novosphingobium sp.]|uniref:hypothetical protein n=1 Tax=Novosphingobium sp. TaxID=1874826 RepID=UPI00261B8D4C|nr:hypothetical protein [Novosphingobium sp.]